MHKADEGPEAAAKSGGDTAKSAGDMAPAGEWAGERRREECRKEKSASLKQRKKRETRWGWLG